MVTNFQQTLAQGQVGESLISRYLRSKGWLIFPAYEKEIDNGKGPRLFLPYGMPKAELVAPDLQGLKYRKVGIPEIRWFEAKSKSTATFYRKKQRWQTGIDKRHYQDYVRVQEVSSCAVWLLFLQENNAHNNAPDGVAPCPTGLFGCPITQHWSDDGWYIRDGKRYDMVYWGIEELKLIAPLSDVLTANQSIVIAAS